jgi:lipopolysaccharide exporter
VLDKIKSGFFKNTFRKNIMMMMGGVVIARAIPFLSIPILYRYFDESSFGVLYLFLSSTLLLTSLSTLKYEFAIVLEKNIVKSFNLSIGIIGLITVYCVLLSVVFYFFKDKIVTLFSLNDVEDYIMLIPLAVFFTGFNSVMNYWFNGRSKFNLLSGSRISQSLVSEAVKIYNGFNLPNSWGLVSGFVYGTLAVSFFYIIFFFGTVKKMFSSISFKEIRILLQKHKKFPRFNLPSDILTNSINFAYVALFFKFYEPSVAGNLGLSISYAYGAFSLISIGYSQVFYKEISDIFEVDKLLQFYWKNAKVLSYFAVAIIIVVELLPLELFVWLLGEKAVNFLPILKIMILWMGVAFVSSSLSFIYAKVNAQDKIFYWDIVHLFTVVGGISVTYYLGFGVKTALWVFAFAQILHYGVSIAIVGPLIKRWKP